MLLVCIIKKIFQTSLGHFRSEDDKKLLLNYLQLVNEFATFK